MQQLPWGGYDMNLKEVEYIVKIAEERNVTRAAEKLFITPSALNQQLIHLEKEIGTPLFFRARNGWTPTEAGEVYLTAARELLRIKRETYNRLQDIVTTKRGSLSIGILPERGASMFTEVYPAFHREYPDITINVCEVSVRNQQLMIARGELDIGFMTLRENQQTDDEYILINSEELILAVPAIHSLCQTAAVPGTGPYPDLDIRLLREEPFALMQKESTMRGVTDSIFRQAEFAPTVLFQTARAQTILDMVEARLCCGLVTANYIKPKYKNIAFFCLPDHPTWDIAVSYKKGSYLSKPARFFIQLATDYWKQ